MLRLRGAGGQEEGEPHGSPSSCQSPPLPSGRAARVMAGNTKQLPPVCRTGQSLPFRTPRGKRVQRSKKFSSPKPLRESASRNAPVFSQRSRSAELCGSKACAVQSKKGVIHKRGNSPSCAPAAQAAKSVRFQGFSRLSNCVIIILIINTLKGARLTWLTFLYKT